MDRTSILPALHRLGITPRYKGLLPLADLIALLAEQPQLTVDAASLQISQLHQISLSVLKSRVRRMAARVRYLDYETFCKINGSWRYGYGRFLNGLVRELSTAT